MNRINRLNNKKNRLVFTSVSNANAENYINNVIAAGGEVINYYMVQKAFAYLAKLERYVNLDKVTWVSPYFGVKRENGLVTKLYDLFGLNNFEVENSALAAILVIDCEGYLALLFDGTTDGMRTENVINWNTNKCSIVSTLQYIGAYDNDRTISSGNNLTGPGINLWFLTNINQDVNCALNLGGTGGRVRQTIPLVKNQRFININIFNGLETGGDRVKWWNNLNRINNLVYNETGNNNNFTDDKIYLMYCNTNAQYAPGYFYNLFIVKNELTYDQAKIIFDFNNTLHKVV